LGTDGNVYQVAYTPGGAGWRNWQDLGGKLQAGLTAAHIPPAGSSMNLAQANVGYMACETNSLGGHGYESSCTGNGGQPEYWCADFARWVWQNSDVEILSGLTAAAQSFYSYGQSNGTLSGTPQVGDAVGSYSSVMGVCIEGYISPAA
jgi:hypothetical protein